MSREQIPEIIAQMAVHPDVGHLGTVAMDMVHTAWSGRDYVFPRPGSPTLAAARLASSAGNDDGGPIAILRRGVTSSEDLDTLTALILLGISANWSKFVSSARECSRQLLWLETHSGLRCLAATGLVLDGSRQRLIVESIADLIRGDRASRQGLSTPELQIGVAWLRSLATPQYADLTKQFETATFGPGSAQECVENEPPIEGRLAPPPRHPATVALFAITGLLFVERFVGGLSRLVLLRRAPTSVWLSVRGLELFSRHEMLGRVVKERRVVVPLEDIRTVEREVRFPRVGLYAGLLALAFGTLVGTRLFVDGLRVTGMSYSLILMGIAMIGTGILIDMLLTGLGDSLRSRCRLVVSTRRGRGWAIGDLDPGGVDRLLTTLSTRLAAERQSSS